ncbi:MAG: aldehyde dehydrogenase family protein [Candidatus Heimdallarchaeota archaeon]|nr:MAG: aldehyde dehydrogenase family protein [Candidatus Heimdallarchaeota archaeon]
MKTFGHLIRGEISTEGRHFSFPNADKVIQDPRVLFASVLKSRGSMNRLAARFSRFIPTNAPELRLLKDYIKVHGWPEATSSEIADIQFANYVIGGVRETTIAAEEASRIKNQMHRDLRESGNSLSLEDRGESVFVMSKFMWDHYDVFKEIAIAEGTPIGLFDWQAQNVFKALNKKEVEFATSRIDAKEIPCAKDGERTILHRYPFGAVGIFPPYNTALGLGFLAIFCSYFAGNATVIRTPARVPLTNMELAYVLCDVMKEMDFPTSAFQAIIGPAKSIANYMVGESPLDAMVYYGDSDVGLQLMSKAVQRGMHFVPELAGSGASLVWKDVDIDKVADFVTHARFFGSGQICLAAKRLFLHEDIFEEFIEALIEKTDKLQPGLPSNSKTDLPIIGTKALYQIIDMTSEAVKKGAKIRIGGYRMNFAGERDDAGLFYKPTVLTDVDQSCKMWYHETFGPVLPIMKVRTFEEALNQANNSPYGLRTSVYSDDPKIWGRFFDEIQAPGISINTDHLHFDDFFPHLGGLKISGVFGGKYFYEVLTYMKYRHFPS